LNDDDANAADLRRISDRKLFVVGSFERRDGECLFIHHVIETIEPFVPKRLLALERNVRFSRARHARIPEVCGEIPNANKTSRAKDFAFMNFGRVLADGSQVKHDQPVMDHLKSVQSYADFALSAAAITDEHC